MSYASSQLYTYTIDALDGTQVTDLKPYFASVEAISDATRLGKDARVYIKLQPVARAPWLIH